MNVNSVKDRLKNYARNTDKTVQDALVKIKLNFRNSGSEICRSGHESKTEHMCIKSMASILDSLSPKSEENIYAGCN